MSVKISFLGGVGEIGKNMTVLEHGDEIIIIDCGLIFPSYDMPGIDYVIPDFDYLIANKHKLRALLLTHGHEDHIGAVPYFLKHFNIPIYGTKLTLALLENKFSEHRIDRDKLSLNDVKAGAVVKFQHFSVEFIKVSHSIAGSCSLAINSPSGVIFHTGDFKIDYTPVDNIVTDLVRIAEIGKKGVSLLMSDSTNVEREGQSMSEARVGAALNNIFNDNIGRRIFVATFSSNIHRLQQIIDLANKYNRRVCFSGRSMINVAECAQRVGELKFDKSRIIDVDKVKNFEDKEVVIITTGSQGEPMSALTRMASDEFNKVRIGANDTIVISASPIPGNEKMVYTVINNLYRKGAKVIYESLAEVHASGHACSEELKLLLSLVKPKNFIPVHGEYRHLKKHAELAERMGVDRKNIHLAEIGNSFELTKRHIKKLNNVHAGAVMVDGLGVGDIGEIVLKDRRILSEEGIVVVVLTLSNEEGRVLSMEIMTRGLLYLNNYDEFLAELKQIVSDGLSKIDIKENANEIKAVVRREIKKVLYKRMMRSPIIIPIVMEV